MTLRGGRIDPIAQRVDIAFQTARPSTDSQIIQKRLTVVELGIFATRRYLATAPPLRSPQDLTQHSCFTIATAEPQGTTWTLHKDGRAHEVRLRGRVSETERLCEVHRICGCLVGLK